MWVANWGPSSPSVLLPWGEGNWSFWQYTATEDGIAYGCESKAVDMNKFNGNVAQLYTRAGLAPIVASVANPVSHADELFAIATNINDIANKIVLGV